MNEININIPYSDFKNFFYRWFNIELDFNRPEVISAIEKAKKYWILFDSDAREQIIKIAQHHLSPFDDIDLIEEFITWTEQNRNKRQETNTAKPLSNFLPVKDLKPYKGDIK